MHAETRKSTSLGCCIPPASNLPSPPRDLLPFEPTAHTASTKAHQLLRDLSLPRSKQKMRNIKLERNDNWIEAANSRIVLDVTGRHDLSTGPRQCMKDLLQYSQELVKALAQEVFLYLNLKMHGSTA
jgi:hypothetical protein